MDALRGALEALAVTLETRRSLVETIAFIEREFRRVLSAERVTVVLGGSGTAATATPRDVIVPLVLDGAVLGHVRIVLATIPTAEIRATVLSLAAPLAAALAWRAHASERDHLHELVRTDALTSLPNRMAFDERLDAAWRASTADAPLTLALLDIDYFKIYNDMYGHVAGDACLRSVASHLASAAAAEGGFVARFGGEEFALIARPAAPAVAVAAVARVLAAFESEPIPHEGSTLGRISISAGVASGSPSGGRAIADLVREADRSLYRAKALGRNRICAGSYSSAGPAVSRHGPSLAGPPAFEDATVGREADLARITAALRNARAVTLVGPPGIGKSRLARLAGIAAQPSTRDGVAYVDLALLGTEADPMGALGAALDVTATSSGFSDGIRDAVRERSTLIVLDNVAEHISRRIANLCEELLSLSPSLAILATSRTALGFAEERAIVVTPLGEEASAELLRVRSGAADAGALLAIARYLGGVPATLETVARFIAANGSAPLERLAAARIDDLRAIRG